MSNTDINLLTLIQQQYAVFQTQRTPSLIDLEALYRKCEQLQQENTRLKQLLLAHGIGFKTQ